MLLPRGWNLHSEITFCDFSRCDCDGDVDGTVRGIEDFSGC